MSRSWFVKKVEWAKHLRPFNNRRQVNKERQKVKKLKDE